EPAPRGRYSQLEGQFVPRFPYREGFSSVASAQPDKPCEPTTSLSAGQGIWQATGRLAGLNGKMCRILESLRIGGACDGDFEHSRRGSGAKAGTNPARLVWPGPNP